MSNRGYAGRPQISFVRAAPRQGADFDLKLVARKPRRQQRQLFFGAGAVERRNDEQDTQHRNDQWLAIMAS